MKSIYEKPNDLKKLKETFEYLENNKEVKTILVLMADKNCYKKKELEPFFKNTSKTILGGIFPGLIHKGKKKEEGILLIPTPRILETVVFNLDSSSEEYFDILNNKFQNNENITGTMLIYIHGLGNKYTLLDSLFNYFGIDVNYLGAGTGSLKDINIASVFSNEGIHENAAVIGLTKNDIEISVGHGWSISSESLKVTKTNGNELISINWEPAFEVYKRIVEKHSDKKFSNTNFADIAKSYPLGIVKADAEMLVRDPLAVEENKLILIDRIEEGEYINILYGDKENLINGAKKAKEKLSDFNENSKCFCIDCITRANFLGDDYKKELDIINTEGYVDGVLSLGEIGNSGESFLESYNKTIIFAKW